MKEQSLAPLFDQFHQDGLGLNDLMTIYADDRDPDSGNASHVYRIVMDLGDESTATAAYVQFQHGARNLPDSTPGATENAILAILIDRLRGFQSGPFACRENAIMLTHLEEAMMWSERRVRTRARQQVLGKNEAHKS